MKKYFSLFLYLTASTFFLTSGCRTNDDKEEPTIFRLSFTGYDHRGEATWCYKPMQKIRCEQEEIKTKKRYGGACLDKGFETFDCGCNVLCSKLVPLF